MAGTRASPPASTATRPSLALGGGAVGDLAGFVSATYMRGTNFVQLPTTVLAQVDASSGGKTAIDHAKGKNLIGAFHQPRLVIVDTATVDSLPDREYRSGLAEVVKHGIVLEARVLRRRRGVGRGARRARARRPSIGSSRARAGSRPRSSSATSARATCAMVLNYGHTIGHAIEAATGFARMTHGEAVALGIAAEAALAVRLGVASAATRERQERLLARLGLPTRTVGHRSVARARRDDARQEGARRPRAVRARAGDRAVQDRGRRERATTSRAALAEITRRADDRTTRSPPRCGATRSASRAIRRRSRSRSSPTSTARRDGRRTPSRSAARASRATRSTRPRG